MCFAFTNYDYFCFLFAAAKPQKSHRPKKGSDRDTQIVQFDLRDHSNYSPPKRASSKKTKNPKKPSLANDELPTGFAYFNSNNNRDPFAPITLAPVPENVYKHVRKHKKSTTSHFKNRIYQDRDGETEPTTMQSIQNVVIQPKPTIIHYGTVDDVPTTYETFKPDANISKHLVPEMYKFTLDDAVVRPHRNKHLKKVALKGPVTTAQSFDELPSNIDVHTQPITSYGPIPTAHIAPEKPKYYYRHTRNNERNVSKVVRKVERGRPGNPVTDSVRHASRQFRRVEARPWTTTENPLTETNGNDELQIKATVEKWPLQLQRFTGRSRQEPKRRQPVSASIARITPDELPFESQQNLEVSPSYTKQRTQGINSGEEASTTPMTIAPTLRNKSYLSAQQQSDEDAAAAQKQGERVAAPPLLPNGNYFQ